nr:hypothetical protein CFP56_49205 [Quercus suber]
MQEPSVKCKKVSKKGDRVSDMTIALKEYIAMTKVRFSGKRGKASGSSDQFAKSTTRGDPYLARPFSILSGSGYMDEVNDGNLAQCQEMFRIRMTLPLFLHLVDELRQHGYLREGKGDVNV